MTILVAFQHPFGPTAQQLSNSANLTHSWIYTQANHTYDKPDQWLGPYALKAYKT